MKELLPFSVVNRAGVGVTVYAADSTAAVLARCTQLAEAVELAQRQGIRRRLVPDALPASVEAMTLPVPPISDLYGSGEGVRTYRVPSDSREGVVYTVYLVDDQASCECPDYVARKRVCKHARKARELEAITR